ncbi:hypothetical protein U3516DRAFT_795632 [Neocallimastix sp. 'constans']
MNNCTIQYNKAQFIHVDIICTKQTQIEPQVVFKNSIMKKKIIFVNHNYEIKHPELYKCSTIKYINCSFIHNKRLIYSHFSQITIDNCYFLETEKSNDDCSQVQSFIISSNTLLHGNSIVCEIENCVFNNITLRNSIPAISDAKYSDIKITNWIFLNLNVNNGLLGEESKYVLKNVILKNIKTNSKALFHILYQNIEFNNVEVKDFECIGDGGDTSFILYDSGEANFKMTIKNFRIQDGISNGPLIKIIGNSNEFLFENSNITNIISYGSFISNESKNSKVIFSNVKISENINTSKEECGGIHFNNNINLSITNSKFINNNSKSNGGAICFDEISNLRLNLSSNEFSKNNAVNGGAIYMKNGKIINMNENKTLIIENNIFNENSAEDFGGAMYSEFQKIYLAILVNNKFSYNKAGILGGGIFSPNSVVENLFNLENNIYLNNTVNSIINDYTSKPAYILLEPDFPDNLIQITTGAYLNLVFTLYDEFNRNTCSFIQGKFYLFYYNLNNFANPNKYNLKFKIENYNDDIELRIMDLEVLVSSCNSNHILNKIKCKIKREYLKIYLFR